MPEATRQVVFEIEEDTLVNWAQIIDDWVDVGEIKDSLFDAVAANEWA